MKNGRKKFRPFSFFSDRDVLRLAGDHLAERCLGGSEPRDRHAIGRARHVVESDLVAERHRCRIAAVFAADADLEARPGLAAAGDADLDEFADAVAVDRNERIDFKNSLGDIGAEEARRVVAADAVGRLDRKSVV